MPSLLGSFSTVYGTKSFERCTSGSSQRRPMKRLIEYTVFVGFVIAWRFAIWPTSRSPCLLNATTDGTVRPPSALGMTVGSPPSMTATTELVVPRSIPMMRPMSVDSLLPAVAGLRVCFVRSSQPVWSVWSLRATATSAGRRTRSRTR